MADNDIEKEIREEIKRARLAPRKPGALKRALVLLAVLAVVLGAVGYAAFRDLNSMDSIRRLFTYNKVAQGEDGRAELFRFDSDRSARYEALGDDLLIVSTTRVLLLGDEGETLWSKTVSFKNPAVEIGGKHAAVYDVGGKELYILNARGLVRDMSGESENGILSASLNASDYLALTTLKSGYRAAVSAYDNNGSPLFTFNSSEHYLTDACVLNDNRRLAAAELGEADGIFASTIRFFSFDSERAISETTLGGAMALSLRPFGDRLAVLEDARFTVFEPDGSLAGSSRYPYPYLRGKSLRGADYAVLLLSRYRSGGASRIVTVDGEGGVLATLDAQHEVLDVSAAGRYVAVLYADSLTIYTSDLAEYASLPATDYAKRVVMRDDGSALLLGASRAWLNVPK